MNGSQDNPVTPAPTPEQTPQQPQAPPVAAAVPPATGWFQTPPSVAQDPRAKSAPLACFLSLMPGLGQVYTGYYARGFAHAITVAGIITLLAGAGPAFNVAPFLALFMAFFWAYNIIDAGRRAVHYNQMLAGGTVTEAFPPEMKMPGMNGSIFAGVGLIVIGALALSYTKYDMSLAWVEDWWPLAPIIVGVYLVGLAVRDRMKEAD